MYFGSAVIVVVELLHHSGDVIMIFTGVMNAILGSNFAEVWPRLFRAILLHLANHHMEVLFWRGSLTDAVFMAFLLLCYCAGRVILQHKVSHLWTMSTCIIITILYYFIVKWKQSLILSSHWYPLILGHFEYKFQIHTCWKKDCSGWQ